MSDSDNDDIDLVVNQIIMNNVKATELIKELFDNNLLQDEVGETSNKRPRGPRKDRGREEGHNKLVADYFAEHPVYNDVDFDRRFRMSRRLFLRIVNDLDREVDFFKQHWDARGVKGFSPLQKCASAIRQLAYGSTSDAFDEYLRMSETTSRDCLDHFCKGIIYLYMRQYLRKPTATDVQAIYALHEQTHGLPGMLGSIDYMHWYWKNCPMAWRGQFHRGDHPGPSNGNYNTTYDLCPKNGEKVPPFSLGRIPMVQQILQDFFNGKELEKHINPEEDVISDAVHTTILSKELDEKEANIPLFEATHSL
ncbi:hypothetical protein OSB04_005384 [Centaurea solstitialis]|uniref:Harbinger transposase-derived protein n=1 Tax=Centaurea solstitialis TaxID=347529 RepID=A0AA38WRE4_9ASTR|nr:hypothetical protein OSB04_005384 [Centaurea solstitialis]